MRSQSPSLPVAAKAGFLQRALGLFSRKEYVQGGSWGFSATDASMLERIFGRGSYTGRAVTDDFAMGVSAVHRCVMLLSQTVGSLPWAMYERLGPRNSREVEDHPLADVLLHSPNADMDRMQFRETITANLAFRGNSYSLKETRADGSVISLYPFPSKTVIPAIDRETGAMKYAINDRGRTEVYPAEKIWHIRLPSFDGRVGLAPLSFGRQAIALAAAAEEFGARFFANGARVSGVVKIPAWLEDDQRKKAKANLDQTYSGLENSHKLMLLEGGMSYEQMSANPSEAQHNELRGFQIPEICRFFGIPPHLVFDLSHGSYNNVETLAGEFVMFGLLPYLVRIETAAQKQLLKPADRRKYFIRFNFEGLLRANSLERAQFYAAMLQNGVLSRNEVREKENLNAVDEPGMDDRTVQTNLAFIQLLEAMVKTGAATGRGDPAGGADPAAKSFNFSLPEIKIPEIKLPDSVRLDLKDANRELAALLQRSFAAGHDEIKAILGRLGEIQASELELRRKEKTLTIRGKDGTVIETITLGGGD